MYNKVGVIGDKDAVLAFKSVGFEVFPAKDKEEAAECIKELSKKDFAVLYITEELAAEIPEVLEKAKKKEYPIITPIPTGNKNLGLGMAGIKKDVEKAIGVDILFNDK